MTTPRFANSFSRGTSGMITAPLLSMFLIPAAYLLMRRPREAKASHWRFWAIRRETV